MRGEWLGLAGFFIAFRLCAVMVIGAVAGSQGNAQDLTSRLATMSRETYHSEIRVDYDAARDRTRIWINSNEDDTRLWSPAGAQLDMEFRASALVPGRESREEPAAVTLEIASLGTLVPRDGPQPLELVADGRALIFLQASEPAARSGAMLFLATRVTMPVEELRRLATASRVDGRIWGHPFALVPHQLEILRAFAWRLTAR